MLVLRTERRKTPEFLAPHVTQYDCQVCGCYAFSEQLWLKLNKSDRLNVPAEELSLVSGYTRERADKAKTEDPVAAGTVFRSEQEIRDIIENAPKRIPENADKLLDAMMRRTDYFSKAVSFKPRMTILLDTPRTRRSSLRYSAFLKS